MLWKNIHSVGLLALIAQLYAVQLTTARMSALDGVAGSFKAWTADLTTGDGLPAQPDSHTGESEDSEELGDDDCNAQSLKSKPGMAWNKLYGWRYDTSVETDPGKRAKENYALREEAYLNLVKGASPWPDWFEPTVSLLPVGTLFQMAMSSTQKDDRPGGFGTFDEIDTLFEVRDDLAVLKAWKPDVQRVNEYRVIEQMPVYAGPVGPQVDPEVCVLLPGRFSQFQMLVKRENRMVHLELVKSHPIDKSM